MAFLRLMCDGTRVLLTNRTTAFAVQAFGQRSMLFSIGAAHIRLSIHRLPHVSSCHVTQSFVLA